MTTSHQPRVIDASSVLTLLSSQQREQRHQRQQQQQQQLDAALTQWPGWERDQQLAVIYAPKITAAFTNGMAAARVFLAQFITGEVRVTPTYAAQQVRNSLVAALKPVLDDVWTEGYALGAISAHHILSTMPAAPASTTSASALIVKLDASSNPYPSPVTGPDWGEWQPGDAEAAAKVMTGSRLRQLLHQWGVNIIHSISETKLDDLAQVISQALASGKSSQSLADDIESMLNVPSRAKMIAQTETSRASTAATLDQYLDAGVGDKQWLVSPDERVCKVCLACAAEGPVPLQQAFESGVDGPPAHPNCRCTTLPASVGDFDLSDMTVEPLPGFNVVPLGQPAVTKVGPHGYVHGWKFVGIPNYDEFGDPKPTGTYTGHPVLGGAVRHPVLGHGTITDVSPDKSHISVHFKGGSDGEFPVDSADFPQQSDFKDVEPEDVAHPKVSKPFTPNSMLKGAEKKATSDYVKPSTTVNSKLRFYKDLPPGSGLYAEPTIKTLDKMIGKRTTKDDVTLFRGVALTPEMRKSMVPGATFTDPAYTSLTGKPYVAKDFAELRATGSDRWGNTSYPVKDSVPAMMLVHVPAGSHIGQGQDSIAEYILPRRTTLTVRGVSDDGRVFAVDAKEPEPAESAATSQKMSTVPPASHRLVHEPGDGVWLPPHDDVLHSDGISAGNGNGINGTGAGTDIKKSHSGESYTTCKQGHKHWGKHGAAGILIRARRPNGEYAYLLQQRAAAASDQPGKWSVFGGAVLPHETPLAGAIREVNEELGPVNITAGRELSAIPEITKVGPKGYIHGWICVRPPCGKVGDSISHPDHGNGVITSAGDDGELHGVFADGTSGVLHGGKPLKPASPGKLGVAREDDIPQDEANRFIFTGARNDPDAQVNEAGELKAMVADRLQRQMSDVSTQDLAKLSLGNENDGRMQNHVKRAVALYGTSTVMPTSFGAFTLADDGDISAKVAKASSSLSRVSEWHYGNSFISNMLAMNADSFRANGMPDKDADRLKELAESKPANPNEPVGERRKAVAAVKNEMKDIISRHRDQLLSQTVGRSQLSDEDEQRLRAELTSSVVNLWAISSNDSNVASLAMQRAAQEEFGLDDAMPWSMPGGTDAVDKFYTGNHDALHSFVKAQYALTQQDLKNAGIKSVTLYRGMQWDDMSAVPDWAQAPKAESETGMRAEGDVVPLKSSDFRPVSSWTSDSYTALGFAGDDGYESGPSVVIRSSIPAERILSTPRSGNGAQSEYEWTVLSTPGDVAVEASNSPSSPYDYDDEDEYEEHEEYEDEEDEEP